MFETFIKNFKLKIREKRIMSITTFRSAGFNPAPPTVLHIDLNSCFASVEQQANPLLRGKPVAVAAYTTAGGCILAASVEAKRKGVRTGMRVREGKALCPDLVILASDPDKYRFVNRKLVELLSGYTDDLRVASIDEVVMNLKGNCQIVPLLYCREDDGVTMQPCSNVLENNAVAEAMRHMAKEIKTRIKTDIGEWLTVSIGISTNRYLAKIASSLHKPDGLDIICRENIEETLSRLQLEDLCGIKAGYGARLRRHGIATPIQMYRATAKMLSTAFASRIGYDWWLWLHGQAPLTSADRERVKTIGHSYALKVPHIPTDPRLHQIFSKLVEKAGRRLRRHGFVAGGIHISCAFSDNTAWNHGEKLSSPLFASSDLFAAGRRILLAAPARPVRILAVTCYFLSPDRREQLDFFDATAVRKRSVVTALDVLADRWGEGTVFPGRMLGMGQKVLDRIAFGSAAT